MNLTDDDDDVLKTPRHIVIGLYNTIPIQYQAVNITKE